MLNAKRNRWILLVWLACMGSAQAAMYKWVDDNGVTQYTQFPPPNQKAEVVAPPPPPAEDPVEARKRLDDALKAQEQQDQEQATAEEEQAQASTAEEQRKRNCAIARSNLEKLTTGGRKRIIGEDGVASYLTDEDREQRIAESRKNIEEYCD